MKSATPLVSLATLAILLKIPTLHMPAYWDEIAWARQSYWLTKNHLWRALPGFHAPAAFWGHPPGLHLSLAILWKLFGQSMFVAHLLIAVFAAIGICATFLLARHFYSLRTAIFSALFLLISPLYFAQSGMFLADIPVTALGVLSIYLALERKYVPYLICASFLVLMKETAVALLTALILFRFFSEKPISKRSFLEALRYSVPFFVIGSYVIAQKITTGHFFTIYEFEFQLFEFSLHSVMTQFALITKWIFIEQYRYLFTVLIVLNFIINAEARKRPELLLFALVLLFSGYSFSIIYFLPRYLLPVLPFFYILGAVSLTDLIKTSILQTVAVAAVLCTMVLSLFSPSPLGNGEANLNYLDAVKMHQTMANELSSRYTNARILTLFPHLTQLNSAVPGYVKKPLKVVPFRNETDLGKSDLILVSTPAGLEMKTLWELAETKKWRLLKQVDSGEFEMKLYGKPVKNAVNQ